MAAAAGASQTAGRNESATAARVSANAAANRSASRAAAGRRTSARSLSPSAASNGAQNDAGRAPPRASRKRTLGSRSAAAARQPGHCRSEEHTSELQSLRHLVCRLLLEKKKKKKKQKQRLSMRRKIAYESHISEHVGM